MQKVDYKTPKLWRQHFSVFQISITLQWLIPISFLCCSFVEEFVGDPVDGVTLLIELLRAVQVSQSQQQQKCPPQVCRHLMAQIDYFVEFDFFCRAELTLGHILRQNNGQIMSFTIAWQTFSIVTSSFLGDKNNDSSHFVPEVFCHQKQV